MATSRTTKSMRPATTPRAMRMSPDERREQLLGFAIKVFAEHGLVASNHAMVAAAAKVSVPTVFFYFKTREALLDAVLNELERFYASKYAPSPAESELPAVETLMLISKRMTGTLETHPDYARIMAEWGVSVRSDIWPRYLRLYRKMNRMMAKVIERGQREGTFRPDLDPEDEAAILHASSSALIQMMETGASAERLDKFQRTMIQSVLVQIPPAPTTSGRTAARKGVIKQGTTSRA